MGAMLKTYDASISTFSYTIYAYCCAKFHACIKMCTIVQLIHLTIYLVIPKYMLMGALYNIGSVILKITDIPNHILVLLIT